MQFSRLILPFLLVVVACSEETFDPEKTIDVFHHRNPRHLSIFSRPAKEDAKKDVKPQTYPPPSGILSHLGNVLHGGSIGVEFNPLGGILGHAKKILPGVGGHDTVGQPSHEKEPHEANEEGPLADWEDALEEEDKPEPDAPEDRPKPERPRWEDIGEMPYEDGAGILQPRYRRPKRFIESKIYHVPLVYMSNARPYKITIGDKNLNSKA